MQYKDYYQSLGVDRKASAKEIKSAYRKLAREHHPDANPGDPKAEGRFKEINEAYEVLSDETKRAQYDRLGTDFERWQRSGGRPDDFWRQFAGGQGQGQPFRTYSVDPNDLFGGAGPFSDFFNMLFGGTSRGPRPPRERRGQDIQAELEISLGEAYHGALRQLDKEGRRLQVRIPPGAQSGTMVRVRGEGTSGTSGGQAGDLYLRVRVAPDPRFERKGDDLYVSVPVDLCTAVLGGEVSVPTLSGEVRLKVPAGSQNGQVLRVRGRGMPRLKQKDEHGDLYAQLIVRLPTELTPRQRELFEELSRLS